MKLLKNKKITVFMILMLLSGTVIGCILVRLNTQQNSVAAESVSKPFFLFDSDRTSDWWTYGNRWPDIKEYTGNQTTDSDLPIAEMVAYRGKQREFSDGCFVSTMYNKGTIDVETAVQKKINNLSENQKDSSVVTSTGTSRLIMQTPEGSKEYTVHRFDVDVPNIQKGNEFGFIPLDEGYIEVRGVCPTADLLPETESVLSAIKLNSKNYVILYSL
ncbi:MAG: hypothetical protein EOO00_02985 [Chitinophagaceae bacterium]|nr:MAG: hypothetical protein EOO00_02985 [Chitinophagaceae bacterium]